MASLRRRRNPSPFREVADSPGADYARWVCGDVTKFCGRGVHQGDGTVGCKGRIVMGPFETTCLCACHEAAA